MKWTISRKLFLALIVVSLVILLMSAVFGQLSFQRGFHAYLTAQEAPVIAEITQLLREEHATNQGWGVLRQDPERWRMILREARHLIGGSGNRNGRAPPPPSHRRPIGDMPGPHQSPRPGPRPYERGRPRLPPGAPANDLSPTRITGRLGLYDTQGALLAGNGIDQTTSNTIGILVDNTLVAELRIAPLTTLGAQIDIEFARQQGRSIAFIALALLALAAAASWIIARQFTRPIRDLAEGTRAIAQGDYEQPIVSGSRDELGSLANDVNALARVLQNNRESRRRWLADINHEMRTPLAVLRAELQSLQDGYRPFNDQSVNSLQTEVDHLEHLIDDLYTLSSSDESNMEYRYGEFDVTDLLNELVQAAKIRVSSAGLALEATPSATDKISIYADAKRVSQLVNNLLENAIRYTDAPGTIFIKSHHNDDQWRLTIEDTAPGVPNDQHERIFERLYRVDRSRNRQTGGSGLGLAICSAIVAGHGGTIKSSASAKGGLKIDVTLPRHPAQSKKTQHAE